MRREWICLITGLFAYSATAQLDSSSAVLLRPSSLKDSPENLDTSRYKVRAPESHKGQEDELDEKPGTFIPSPVPARSGKSKNVKKKDEPQQNSAENALTAATGTSATGMPSSLPTSLPAAPAIPAQAPRVTEQVRELILGGS